jgi:hypothetical protein
MSYKVNDASGWQIVSRGNPQWLQVYLTVFFASQLLWRVVI